MPESGEGPPRHGARLAEGLSRRRFIGRSAAAGLGLLGAAPMGWSAAAATTDGPRPPAFPDGIALERRCFENWAREIRVEDVWTCVPRAPEDVVAVANWAAAHGYRVRPRGMMHNWSPLTIRDTPADARTVLVDTTRHLTAMRMVSSSPAAVRAQSGATMERLLELLERSGHGFTSVPAPGDLTVGGVLAVGGHGSAIPGDGEGRLQGRGYGSLSNLVLSLTAVVWNARARRYVLRTFDRSHPHCKAFLTHLGRAFLTEVTLQVGPDVPLRCVSTVDIPAHELFAPPRSGASRTFASFVERDGRAEAIWYAFSEHPWLKVWSVAPTRPPGARPVTAPYNYPFTDQLPLAAAAVADEAVSRNAPLTPAFGRGLEAATTVGLPATLSQDIWGTSKNLLLYIRPTTLRVTANGYAVLTARRDIQRVVNEFTSFYLRRLGDYRARGRYPINVGLEIRVTGLDVPWEVQRSGAATPVLSALRPRPDRRAWDVAVWFDVLTFPGTPGAERFYRDLETWAFRTFAGGYAAVRPEWSKGWAYTSTAAWADPALLTRTIPRLYSTGRHAGDGWDWAVTTLDAYDPHRLFGNTFLDGLMQVRGRAHG